MSRRTALASLACGGLVVLAACGGGSTAPTTALDRDCGTFSSATVSLRLASPHGGQELIASNVAAAERISRAADEVTTPEVKEAAQSIADAAEPYAAALRAHRVERAIALEGILRQRADRFSSVCGLPASAVYGLPANR